MTRTLVIFGALFGLAGVALSALAAHAGGGTNLDTAARFLLAHAPVLLAAAALLATGLVHRALGSLGAAGISLGTALFAGDLTVRALAGAPLFANAAPTGGIILMAGWLMLAVAGMMRRSQAR